jgi:hypothetical protein
MSSIDWRYNYEFINNLVAKKVLRYSELNLKSETVKANTLCVPVW